MTLTPFARGASKKSTREVLMKTAKPMPSIDRLRELLEVSEDSASGLRWLTTSKKVRAGATAGSVRSDGYWRVFIDGQRYMTHRIVYAMSVGEIPYGMQVDHADMNPGNNRPENLRLVSASENQWNTGGSRVKASGLPKNISRHAAGYQVQIKRFGKSYNFWSRDLAECVSWLEKKRDELHGQFSRPCRPTI
ncbi:hypothetical protein AO986_30005 [Pseudomonas aeruginosa]|nr:hypothetical protein AO986_30005 [Pseudomonas aeruginosa]